MTGKASGKVMRGVCEHRGQKSSLEGNACDVCRAEDEDGWPEIHRRAMILEQGAAYRVNDHHSVIQLFHGVYPGAASSQAGRI